MQFAVNQAKEVHKAGTDISALAPDLKAVKIARQGRETEEVLEISKRIIIMLEDIRGEDLMPDFEEFSKSNKRRKKKKSRK
jgi:hypothetical protein